MIIRNRYWLEKNGTACFSSRAKRSIPPVLSAKLRCSNMVIAGEQLFRQMGENLAFTSGG